MKTANEIYVQSEFRELLIEMHQTDKVASFLPSAVPKGYAQRGEPKTIPGVNFINVLHTAFTLVDPKRAKRY